MGTRPLTATEITQVRDTRRITDTNTIIFILSS